MVDPADEAGRIRQKAEEMGGQIRAVLLTHGHFDHITAAEELRRETEAPVYAFKEEEILLADTEYNLSAGWASPVSLRADVLVGDKEELSLAGFRIQVIHTPGHTAGSCCYYFPEEGALMSGDTLFAMSVGRTDLPTASGAAMERSIKNLLQELPGETKVFRDTEKRRRYLMKRGTIHLHKIFVELSENNFEYDIYSLVRAFYPGSEVKVYLAGEEPEGEYTLF